MWSSDLADGADTIVARATPNGRGALGVVRVSGGDCRLASAKVCPGLDWSRARVVQLVAVHGCDSVTIDHGVAIVYHGPRSYTGEDQVELFIHGSGFLMRETLEAWVAAGCRVATPGEFTRRAVANGKMDLVQAEAVRDLVEAETARQANAARRQMEGRLSARFGELRHDLVELLGRVEAGLDFVEQGISVDVDDLDRRRGRLIRDVDGLLATARAGARLRHGVRVAIIGRVNAGKSTLFNLLAGRERAIVAAGPGTTRDVLEAQVEIAGLPVTLVDTAGLRESHDEVEVEGMRRMRQEVVEADIVVQLWAADDDEPEPPRPTEGKVIRIRSRGDLEPNGVAQVAGWLVTSCHTGDGVAEVRAALAAAVSDGSPGSEDGMTIDLRHGAALAAARTAIVGAAFDEPELAAEELRSGLTALSELIGDVEADEVLDSVFATFCIGK